MTTEEQREAMQKTANGADSDKCMCTESMAEEECHQPSLKRLSYSREITTCTADIGF
jgi:hypothetical protein